MSEFIDHIKNAEFIQFLRSQIKPENLAEFDKMVKTKVKEYNDIWLDIQPELQKCYEGVKDVGDRAEEQHRSDKE